VHVLRAGGVFEELQVALLPELRKMCGHVFFCTCCVLGACLRSCRQRCFLNCEKSDTNIIRCVLWVYVGMTRVCVCVCVCVFEVQLIVLFPVLQQGMVKCLLWV
jgi:hypothetical protein